MIPKPVPNNLGLINMGTVGTMIAQKMAMQIPNKNEGTHLTNELSFITSVDSVTIMKR